jgi:hypothetical protein
MGCSNSKDDYKFSLASKLYCCRKDFEFYDKLMCAGTNNDTNRKMAVLKNLDIFILDNSIRESTVTQIRGHLKDDKYAIWNAVRATGIQNCIEATFSSLPSVEDQWLEELRDTSMLDPATGVSISSPHIFHNNLTVLLDQNVSAPHILSYTVFSFNNINKSNYIYRYLNNREMPLLCFL